MTKKRILAFALCFIMLFSLPGMASAVDEALNGGSDTSASAGGESGSTGGESTEAGGDSADSGDSSTGDGDGSTTITPPDVPKGDSPDGDANKGDGADHGDDANKGDDANQGGDTNKGDDAGQGGDANKDDNGEQGGDANKGDDANQGGDADKGDDANQGGEEPKTCEHGNDPATCEQCNPVEEEPEEESFPAIEEIFEDEDTGINVLVNAPEGAFPEGTSVTVLPIQKLAGEETIGDGVEIPAAITNIVGDINEKTGDELVKQLNEEIQKSVADALAEEPVEPQQMLAFDITFLCDGKEVQPADGYTVDVQFEIANESELVDVESPDQQLQVFHVETDDRGETKATAVNDAVAVDAEAAVQNVAVEAESFSIYVVTAVEQTNGYVTIQNGGKYTVQLTKNGQKVYFRSSKSDGNINNRKWSSSNQKVAEVGQTGSYNRNVEVTLLAPGKTTITYAWGNGNNQKETFTLIVEAKSQFKITDQIAENGCFVPAGAPEGTVSYRWYRSESGTGNSFEEVTGNAVSPDYTGETNGVNIAVDQGARMYYQVAAIDADGKEIGKSEVKQVPYYNEIQNGSFEYPNVFNGGYNTYSYRDSRYIQVPDSDKNLYWKTTATDHKVEIAAGKGAWDAYRVNNGAMEGAQFAELNCEQYGSLYQDVVTAPDTQLYWNLAHRGRYQADTMFVIVMPTKDAKDIRTQKDVIDLIGDFDKYAAIAENSGETGTQVDGTNIMIWKVKSDNQKWHNYTGQYDTIDGQYLTRFFFISANAKSATEGNLLDDVGFSTEINYSIQYYADDVLQDTLTEKGSVSPGATVSASSSAIQSLIAQGYELDHTLRGEVDYGKKTAMSVSPYQSNVLKLYFTKSVTPGVAVSKIVKLPSDLTAQEKAALVTNYQATFELQDGNGAVVATATVKVNPDGEGVEWFVNGQGARFEPAAGMTYTVVEKTYSTIDGYQYAGSENGTGEAITNLTQTITTSDKKTGEVTFVNVYEEKAADKFSLTIIKEVNGEVDHQSFLFDVTGPNGFAMTVTIQGTGRVTITGLAAGEYTVTERSDWSWRYEQTAMTNGGKVTLHADAPEGEVTVTNTRKDNQWLSGNCYAVNRFVGGKLTATASGNV